MGKSRFWSKTTMSAPFNAASLNSSMSSALSPKTVTSALAKADIQNRHFFIQNVHRICPAGVGSNLPPHLSQGNKHGTGWSYGRPGLNRNIGHSPSTTKRLLLDGGGCIPMPKGVPPIRRLLSIVYRSFLRPCSDSTGCAAGRHSQR